MPEPDGSTSYRYSVNVLWPPTGAQFSIPYAAETFPMAINIAEIESQLRGWGKRLH